MSVVLSWMMSLISCYFWFIFFLCNLGISLDITKLWLFFISFHHYSFYVLLVQGLWASPVRKSDDHSILKSYGKLRITCNMNILHLNWTKTWAGLRQPLCLKCRQSDHFEVNPPLCPSSGFHILRETQINYNFVISIDCAACHTTDPTTVAICIVC